jgi:hypothetical protein
MTPTKARKLVDELVTAASEHGEARTELLHAQGVNAQAAEPVHSEEEIARRTKLEIATRARREAFRHAVLIALADDDEEAMPL